MNFFKPPSRKRRKQENPKSKVNQSTASTSTGSLLEQFLDQKVTRCGGVLLFREPSPEPFSLKTHGYCQPTTWQPVANFNGGDNYLCRRTFAPKAEEDV